MSAVEYREFTLLCDKPDCRAHFGPFGVERSRAALRKLAATYDWTHVRGDAGRRFDKDLCPAHAPRYIPIAPMKLRDGHIARVGKTDTCVKVAGIDPDGSFGQNIAVLIYDGDGPETHVWREFHVMQDVEITRESWIAKGRR